MTSSQHTRRPGKEVAQASRAKKPNRYTRAFENCEFAQTKWPHKPTLEALGLLEDVTAILQNIGLASILDMDHLAYPEALIPMMGTFQLDIKESSPPLPIEELGCIRFKVKEVAYELSIKSLCEAYGFKTNYGGEVKYSRESDEKAWSLLGYEKFKGSRVRSATIRNPAVRYVHRIIAHSMFARKEADKIKEDEFALLMNGLFPIFRMQFEAENIASYEGINLGIMLANQILEIKRNWVLKQAEGAIVYIGGFLTPILLACEVPLGEPSDKPRTYIDIESLKRHAFLDKMVHDRLSYKFFTENGEVASIDLPHRSFTSIVGVDSNWENLRFMYGEEDEVELARSKKRSRSVPTDTIPRELPLGSVRYYHAPYKGKVSTESIRYALDGVEKNQRHGKWLSKSLHKVSKDLGKKIKKMASQLKDLNALVGTYVLGSKPIPRNDDGSTKIAEALEEARRYSVSLPLREARLGQGEASRSSTYEQRRRHIPTPSPPSSDNELIHFSDSDSEE